MEPPRKSHAIELSLFPWHNARWCHWKCGYTQLQAATINYLHAPVTALMFGCFGTQIPGDPEIRNEGWGHLKTNVVEQTIESISVYLFTHLSFLSDWLS